MFTEHSLLVRPYEHSGEWHSHVHTLLEVESGGGDGLEKALGLHAVRSASRGHKGHRGPFMQTWGTESTFPRSDV